ncbi:alkaline shock response membrane anchor protein AmaP [Streptomyces sp. NPDC006733]|uniref:alkaline shock response membrane anchor protein AmaP n=1 Tax=Streptomyces sp. NPDC006733 TaxID=3155460 RepID=UPI0033CEACEE
MRTTVNRILLGLLGITLLTTGLTLLLGSRDLHDRWPLTLLPDRAFTRTHGVVLSAADRTALRAESWWWPVVFTGLGLLLVAALLWLLLQMRPHHLARLPLDGDDAGTATVYSTALREVLNRQTRGHDGAHRARTVLTGSARSPRLHMTLRLAERSSPAAVLATLEQQILPAARTSTSTPHLPAQVRLRAANQRASKVL